MRILVAGSLKVIDVFGELKDIALFDEALDRHEFFKLVNHQPYDAFVIDLVNLGGQPWAYLLNCKARQPQVPVVVMVPLPCLQAAALLESGATVLLPAECGPVLLLKQLQALQRLHSSETKPLHILEAFGARVDLRAHQLFIGQQKVELQLRELEVLKLLLRRPRQALTRRQFLDSCGFSEGVNEQTVDIYIMRLRKLLAGTEFTGRIQTVNQVGYRLDGPT